MRCVCVVGVTALCLAFVASDVLASPAEAVGNFRQEHRSTTDGRLCAAAFVHGRAAFTGCASVASPDGAVGREWCYVEDGAGGPSSEDWGFCAPRIDYGDVRLRVANAYAEKSHEFGELLGVLQSLSKDVARATGALRSRCA